jgi:hypothetical protein
MPTRKPLTPFAAPSLTLQAFKLTHQDTELLENLARELAARSGRAPSRSAALRALIRLSATLDGAILERLADELTAEFTAGVRWGRDSQRRPV